MNSLQAKYEFSVPELKKVRVIIDTDAKNEADDQYAIVHALLTPKLVIRGFVAAHFGTRRSNHPMEESYDELKKLSGLMDLPDDIPIVHGNGCALGDEMLPAATEGSELIVRGGLSDDARFIFEDFFSKLKMYGQQ